MAWWAARAPASRVASIGGSGIVVGALVGLIVVLAGAGGGDSAAAVAVEVTPSPSASASATPRVVSNLEGPFMRLADDGVEATPEAREVGPRVVRDLGGFVEEFGDPAGGDFARLRIPGLGVDAPVGVRSVGGDGIMPLPAGPADTVWYDMSAWGSLGGSPGGGQNAIFSGHVDYADAVPYADVNYSGVGIFINLDQMSPGDIIEIDYLGETLRYAVDWRQEVDAASGNWSEIFSGNVERDSITLVTCSGTFDITSRSYLQRTVVRAVRV